jgi:mercuric ion transport protein
MNRTWKQTIVALPGIGVSLLPKLACPACWPAYAGLLSSLGLGFLVSTAYLLPLTITFLALVLAALVFRANRRRGYGPFLLGMAAAAGILLGKFAWETNYVLYGSVGALVAASLWNSWPRHTHQAACPGCEPTRVR